MLGLVGIELSKNITIDRSQATDDEVLAGFDNMTSDERPPLHLYDGFGSNDIDHICSRIRYMVSALGCDVIVLDHISILCLRQKAMNVGWSAACTKFRTLVQTTSLYSWSLTFVV